MGSMAARWAIVGRGLVLVAAGLVLIGFSHPFDGAANVAARGAMAGSGGVAPWHRSGVQVIGQAGGSIGGLAYSDDGRVLWMAEGPQLVAVDLSDPGTPRVRGRSGAQQGLLHAVAVGSRFVAALERRAGDGATQLVLFDPDPDRPRAVGRTSVAPGALHLAILGSEETGGVAAVGDAAEIHLFDIADPRSPTAIVGGRVAIDQGLGGMVSVGRSLVVLGQSVLVFDLVVGLRLRERLRRGPGRADRLLSGSTCDRLAG